MVKPRKLSAAELRRSTAPETLEPVAQQAPATRSYFIGQERAASALRYGLKVRGAGFHVYAAGAAGTGKETLVRRFCDDLAADLPRPPDWAYVHDFEDPDGARALELPAGAATGFAREMISLIQDVRRELKLAFRSEKFQTLRDQIVAEIESLQEEELSRVDKVAAKARFRVERHSESYVTVPLQADGEPLSSEAYSSLNDEERVALAEREKEVTTLLKAAISRMQDQEEAVRRRMEALEHEVAEHALKPVFAAILERWAEHEHVVAYLQEVQGDLLDRLPHFSADAEEGEDEGPSPGHDPMEPGEPGPEEVPFRYRANPLVSPAPGKGAPVIVEPHPTLYNLLGRVSRPSNPHLMRSTCFLDIKSGALHRANGGFLILHAMDVLKEPFAWEGLKRALRGQQVVPARPREEAGLETESLRPEPIRLDVVVILIGEVELFHELLSNDPDFSKLFTVKAHFSDELIRNEDTEREYARFVIDRARQKGLLAFNTAAIARVIDEAAVMAGSQDRLTASFRRVADLLQEADYQAREAGEAEVGLGAVERALAARLNRVNLYEEHFQRMVERGEILIETDGQRLGQVNGLAVFDVGDHVFARPSRITCTVGLGQGGLVDIEREAELGGPIHTKGVLLLRGFLVSRFALTQPLALSASLAFEQSYGLVDGDSASFAELAALLSAIGNVPLRQDIAVTGSINQKGMLQAIGGATEKVTGFFRVCQAQGLTGRQGVIVPESNVSQLMLPIDVVQAVEEGTFSVWAVSDASGALELLTGVPTGEAEPGSEARDGHFPPGSLYAAVASRLRSFGAVLARTV